MRNDPVIIGLVGLPGAGKTTVTEYLEDHGYVRVILSDVIREELVKRGVTEYTREILQNTGNEMRRSFGPAVLAKRAIHKLRAGGGGKFVIDGIRNSAEIAFLTRQKRFVLMGIIAPSRLRFKRLTKRKTNTLTATYKEFLVQEKRENALGAAATGLRVMDCLKKCNTLIENDGTKKELIAKLMEVLKKEHIL
jgi:dephospho-CoA kinase